MSGECDKCGEHCLDCKCSLTDKLRPFSRRQQNGLNQRVSPMNAKVVPLSDGFNPPAHQIPRKTIDVHGRVEHEAIIRDHAKCKELGLDQYYEIMVYLKRWGGWLEPPPEDTSA